MNGYQNNMSTKNIHIGTSGWSYDHWAGIFYPEDTKKKPVAHPLQPAFQDSRAQHVLLSVSVHQHAERLAKQHHGVSSSLLVGSANPGSAPPLQHGILQGVGGTVAAMG